MSNNPVLPAKGDHCVTGARSVRSPFHFPQVERTSVVTAFNSCSFSCCGGVNSRLREGDGGGNQGLESYPRFSPSGISMAGGYGGWGSSR